MAKTSAKNLILLINGYQFSTYASTYDAISDAGAVDVTGFTDPSKNFIPSVLKSDMTVTMLWDGAANKTHLALSLMPSNGVVTAMPEGYYLGAPTLSLPMMQGNYSPKGQPNAAMEVGQLKFESYGSNYGIEYGAALAHGTITATTTGTGVQDPTGGAVTAVCVGTLHIWNPTITDIYLIKIQHSTTLGSGYVDLVTFTSTGASRTAERIVVASGVINQYRRVIATRTGVAGDSFGFSAHFWHQ